MTESSLQLGRGLRFLTLSLVQNTGEVERYNFRNSATTVLAGPRNSSKTTTLKAIDYCLGDRDSIGTALGARIEEKYQEISLELAIDGTQYRLTRIHDIGLRGQILVDRNQRFQAPDLSSWLLTKLGWPQLSIPLGRTPATATQLVSLSFRSMLRHIYRREDSWTEFATKEQEYSRRAVISMFLGFASQRYETAEYELGQAQRKLAAAEAVCRDVMSSTEESIQALVRQLSLPPIVDIRSLENVRVELIGRIAELQASRNSLSRQASQDVAVADDVPGLDPTLPYELERATSYSAAAAERVASLQRIVEEHERSRTLVQADISRIHRLVDAVEIFDELPIRICPACEQTVDPKRPHDVDSCYLCGQEVSGDVRQRRAEREERALKSELDDLAEAVARARQDLEQAQLTEANAVQRRTLVARTLHDTRASRLAPFVAALEDIATEMGRIEQQLAALPALDTILSRRVTAEESVDEARNEVDRLTRLAGSDRRTISDVTSRCAALAERMNEFVTGLDTRSWVEGSVTVSAENLTFYVGTRPWDDSLGAEARVLFFMAYSYALLYLDRDLGVRAHPPGALLLDNPYQQGIRPRVVAEGINRLADAASACGAQIILTQSGSAPLVSAPHAQIRMVHEYTSGPTTP